jgi:hypothetical protein
MGPASSLKHGQSIRSRQGYGAAKTFSHDERGRFPASILRLMTALSSAPSLTSEFVLSIAKDVRWRL